MNRPDVETDKTFTDLQLAEALREGDDTHPDLFELAAGRLDVLHRLIGHLGLLAPGGTAPRTALEEIYRQSLEGDIRETPAVIALRDMLDPHWGDWSDSLREIEGLPPAVD